MDKGLRKGFWNLFKLLKNGLKTSTSGRKTMDKTPISFEGRTLNKLKVAKKYHSGSISIGVENGLALSNKL
jgi:hypothetical protein